MTHRAPHYTFFGGKGGVGKTTSAAAAAIALADRGRSVLLLSTDPAHSLGDALGVRLSSRATTIAARRGRLSAIELDDPRALTLWLSKRLPRLRSIAEHGTYLDHEDIDRLFRLSLPGVDELIGLIEILRLSRAHPSDEVVIDTAPTGHTLRLLAMPRTLDRIATVLDDMQAKHRFLSESLGGRYLADASDALIDELREQASTLDDLLRDGKACSFRWVTLPEILPFEETVLGVRALHALGIAVKEILVNRVTPPPDRPCAACEVRRRGERRVILRVRRAFPAAAVRLVPALDHEPRGVLALRSLARATVPDEKKAPPGRAISRGPRGRRVPLERRIAKLVPASVSLVLFGGKGGVGKTTCATASALALARARPREKILLLSTDPAHSVGDALDQAIGDDGTHVLPNLFVRELDADRAFSSQRDRYRAAVDELFDAIAGGSRLDASFDRAVVKDLIDLAPSGIDELFALLTLLDALTPPVRSRRAPYRHVVVDTAPTGHTLRLLALPAAALEWVHALLAILLKYRKVVGLGELAEDLVVTARQLRELSALLTDARRTRFIVVTRAAALPAAETRRLLRALAKMKIRVAAVVVNALTQPGCGRCLRAAAIEREQVDGLAKGPRVREGRAMLLAPAAYPPPRGQRALHRWGDTWNDASE